jgi:HK97 family phage prohead protease
MSATHRALLPTTIKSLGRKSLADQRKVRVIASTSSPDRVGDIVVQSGIDLTQYKKNPVVLWGHDHDRPIARCVDIAVAGGRLMATAAFPEPGIDADADWAYNKIKAGLVNATSVGFVPKAYEPINPRDPGSGYRFTKSELLEFSFVAIPMNAEAVIVGRAYKVKPKAKTREVLTPHQREQVAARIILEIAERELRDAETAEEFERAKSRQLQAKRTLGLLSPDDWRT